MNSLRNPTLIVLAIAVAVALGFAVYLADQGTGALDSVNGAVHRETDGNIVRQTDEYLGSASCGGCHEKQYSDWRGSHHEQAMQHASATTVKGNFANTSFVSDAVSVSFTQKKDGFYARLAGTDSVEHDYKVLYTFGTEPLQQYLVAFPDGRLQQLPVAWDTQLQQWFDPQPTLKARPGEWVHWTEGGKNWNSMCADCHSTAVAKNFSAVENRYDTAVEEISVGCESCHGPGRDHQQAVLNGAVAELGDLKIDAMSAANPQLLVDNCGRCHARRQAITEKFEHGSNTLLDHYLPSLLNPPLYHSDGQILDEVFVYGSFLQSKMYAAGVSCVNCHEPHSARLKAEGNQLCTGCHSAAEFDSPQHHHHSETAALAAGNQCIDCHMPGRLYMGNDFRRDHSFRVPRPDLSVAHATPNACTGCHTDETDTWAADNVVSWFGPVRASHFSDVLTAAQSHPRESLGLLVTLLKDLSQPAIARATAASQLAPAIAVDGVEEAVTSALQDLHPLVRASAASALAQASLPQRLAPLAPLLDDPVRAVRIAAAQALINAPPMRIPNQFRESFRLANIEYQSSLMANSDFPTGRLQMAIDAHRRGDEQAAEGHYLAAVAIDNHLNAARMNLAQLYYNQGRLADAEALYRTTITQEPNASEAFYALGLLLAEQRHFGEAAQMLRSAATLGNNPRAWYNLAVLYQQTGNPEMAEKSYLQALQLAPGNSDFTVGLVSLYSQQGLTKKALATVAQGLVFAPHDSRLLQAREALQRAAAN